MSTDLPSLQQSVKKTLTYSLFVFAFIHFTIVIPFKHTLKNYGLGETIKVNEEQVKLLNKQIKTAEVLLTGQLVRSKADDKLRKKPADSAHSLSNNKSPGNAPVPSPSPAIKFDSLLYIARLDSISVSENQLLTLRDKKYGYLKEQESLKKEKSDRTFTIPVLGIVISESVILVGYPTFILSLLCITLFYRLRFLEFYKAADEPQRQGIALPLWVAPIPYAFRKSGTRQWLAFNSLGISLHFIFLYILIDFARFLSISARKSFGNETWTITVLAALVALGMYCYTIYDTWKLEKRREN